MEGTLVAFASLLFGAALAVASPVGAAPGPSPASGSPARVAPLGRLLVAVVDVEALTHDPGLATVTRRLHLADPAATTMVMGRADPARTVGTFRIVIERPSGADAATVRVGVDGAPAVVASVHVAGRDPTRPPQATIVEVLGGDTGIVAHRVGRLDLTPDELRLPTWRLPADAADAVALDGAWWTLGPTSVDAEASSSAGGSAGRFAGGPAGGSAGGPAGGSAGGSAGRFAASHPPTADDQARERLMHHPVSRMRRLVDVSVGDVPGDGTPDVALSFRRPFRPTLLNASAPRHAWTDADGLSAHVGLYRLDDLSEVWVAGTLVRPVRRLAACTGALAVAYSTLRRGRTVATSAWRWQGFAFLPLPELSGSGIPTCIDIDRDGRPEAAIIERSQG